MSVMKVLQYITPSSSLFLFTLLALLFFACWWAGMVHGRFPDLPELRLDIQECTV